MSTMSASNALRTEPRVELRVELGVLETVEDSVFDLVGVELGVFE